LKIAHLFGLAVFLGSLPVHILLGHLVDPAADLQGLALLMHVKSMNVLVLTLPGLVLTLLAGIAVMLRRGMTPNKLRWMAAKLALVALITLNGAFVLTPLARDIAVAAQGALTTGGLPAGFADLSRKEGTFGAANLAMIIAVIGLAVLKPSFRGGAIEARAEQPRS
jgi:hypothetical protein